MMVILGAVKEYEIVLWLKAEFLIFQMMGVQGCFFFFLLANRPIVTSLLLDQ